MADQDWEKRAEEFDKRPVRSTIIGITKGWFVVLAVIGLGLVTGALVWLIDVNTSDVRGQGDAEKIKNSAPNRIESQERFEEMFTEIQQTDKNIQIAADAVAANPGDTRAQTEYTGLRQYCNSVVGDYNAEARKFSSEQFRAVDLPERIDDSDPLTDCKESTP